MVRMLGAILEHAKRAKLMKSNAKVARAAVLAANVVAVTAGLML